MAERVLAQILELWVRPALAARGDDVERAVGKALVILPPNGAPVVQLDDEASWIAEVRATRAIAKGEPITDEDFSEVVALRPTGIDPDAGWIGFASLGRHGVVVAFDFRRNRRRAAALLERAKEFADVAKLGHAAGLRGPVLENAFAAAELCVVAELSLMPDRPTRSHRERVERWRSWSALGNVPSTHAEALAMLVHARAGARYGEHPLDEDESGAAELLATVDEMVSHAARMVGLDIDPP
jgi:HEPN domain-containing protein